MVFDPRKKAIVWIKYLGPGNCWQSVIIIDNQKSLELGYPGTYSSQWKFAHSEKIRLSPMYKFA